MRFASCLVLLAACSPGPARLDPAPILATQFEVASSSDWGIEFRGMEILSAAEQLCFAEYWASALAQCDSDALPKQPTWRVRNHARYARGGQSLRGDRTELDKEDAWRDEVEKELIAQGISIPFGLSSRYPYGPPLLERAEDAVVPIWVVAPTRQLERVLEATQADWRAAVQSAANCGLDYAIRYAYPAKRMSGSLQSDAQIPMPGRGEVRNGGNPLLNSTLLPLAVGNIGIQQEQESELKKRLSRAGLLETDTLKIQTVRWADGVWLGHIQLPGHASRVELAFPLLDAHGAARVRRPHVDAKFGSWFENQFELPNSVESIGRHSAGIWPHPRPPGASQQARRRNWVDGEDAARQLMEREFLCVTGADLDASGGVWIIERLPSSQPLAPDYRVSADVSRITDARESLAGIVIQADLEPEQLIALLRAWNGKAQGGLHPAPVSERTQSAYAALTRQLGE